MESLDDPTKGPGNFYLIDTVVETQGSDIDLRFFLSKGDAKHQLEGTNTEQTQWWEICDLTKSRNEPNTSISTMGRKKKRQG